MNLAAPKGDTLSAILADAQALPACPCGCVCAGHLAELLDVCRFRGDFREMLAGWIRAHRLDVASGEPVEHLRASLVWIGLVWRAYRAVGVGEMRRAA